MLSGPPFKTFTWFVTIYCSSKQCYGPTHGLQIGLNNKIIGWFTLLHNPTLRYRLTRIVVDNEAGPHRNHTVVFLGSEKGIILKFLAKMNKGFLNDSLFLEELSVYNPDKYVTMWACVSNRGNTWRQLPQTKEGEFFSNLCECVCVHTCTCECVYKWFRSVSFCYSTINQVSQPTSSTTTHRFPRPKLWSEASHPDGYSII